MKQRLHERDGATADDSLSIVASDEESVNSEGKEEEDETMSDSFSASRMIEEPVPEIAAKETAKLNRLRIFVLFALLVPTIAIACAVYFYIRAEEEQTFENYYKDNADKIMENFGKNLDVLLEATESLVVASVSYAHSTNQTWPFVTLPDFASRTSIIRSLAETAWIAEYVQVFAEDRLEWESYTSAYSSWVDESIEYMETDKTWKGPIVKDYTRWDVIHDYGEYEKPEEEQGLVGTNRTTDVYFPNWQNFPVVPYYAPTNWDLASIEDIEFIEESMRQNEALITYPYLGQVYNDPTDEAEIEEMGYEVDFIKDYIDPEEEADEPVADLIYPMIVTTDDEGNVKDGNYTPSDKLKSVGLYSITYYWRELLQDILPMGQEGIHVVFDSCRTSFTYEVNGAKTKYLGPSDMHDQTYDFLEVSSPLLDLSSTVYKGVPVSRSYCPYHIRIYPSDTFKRQYTSNDPVYITLTVVGFFAILHTLVFLAYDRLVQRRNRLVVSKANRTRAILGSLFPATVRKDLFGDDEEDNTESESDPTMSTKKRSSAFSFVSTKRQLASFLSETNMKGKDDSSKGGSAQGSKSLSKPIAEVYTDTTIMFADIVGFTAWSSAREPFQVFSLLESLYSSFDIAAKQRGVFKVETVGDCYVAAAGVPEPIDKHAVVIAQFAAKCRSEATRITRHLEVSLGPGTGDLHMRFGLHSGSVIAGVLRGDKARFQLFGNTMNTAARMEQTGVENMIHVSKKTADLIVAAGHSSWVTERKDMIEAKGLGQLQTYFLHPKRGGTMGSRASTTGDGDCLISSANLNDSCLPMTLTNGDFEFRDKQKRLVNWMVELFGTMLKDIQKHRRHSTSTKNVKGEDTPSSSFAEETVSRRSSVAKMVRDEVQEIIELPEFSDVILDENGGDEQELDPIVISELRRYITDIALAYNDNAFHNFEHACQVTMATKKLLSRIVAPEDDANIEGMKDLHNNTYGITSDPLTQFAVVFSALIHDVDHPGVSNQQLVVEGTNLAKAYNGKSVSEQHSVDLAWYLLLEENFMNLRNAIISNEVEFTRFRQLVVNSVMATDIFDKDLKAIRDGRWEKAFDEVTVLAEGGTKIFSNRRATIVIEHVIQASDIAHCMQHWKVYQAWNARLFEEMYAAFRAGRAAKNPADGWYKGELWFFDNYIVPLAKKLKECRVFGVSCDEFLDCALDNREEWKQKGEEITRQLLAEVEAKFLHSCKIDEPIEDIV